MNNQNINDRNDSHNYVQPTELNSNVVRVNTQNSMLGRERSNIVNATMMANDSINKKQAEQINNKFKIAEKKTKKQSFYFYLLLFFCLAAAIIIIFRVIKFIGDSTKNVINNASTTTTTEIVTTSALDRTKNYVNSLGKVRRFIFGSRIIYLLPSIFTTNGELTYVVVNTTEDSISKGVYNVGSDRINLYNSDKTSISEYYFTDNGLKSGNNVYSINDGEFKYYIASENGMNAILLVNGTPGHTFGYYHAISSVSESSFMGKVVETDNAIMVNNVSFSKIDGDKLNYNSLTFSLVS